MNTQSTSGAQHGHTKTVTVYVNGQAKEVEKRDYSFEEVVQLGFPNPNPNFEYTVTYSKGEPPKKEGTLIAGQSIKMKEGMIFDVTETNKS